MHSIYIFKKTFWSTPNQEQIVDLIKIILHMQFPTR